MGAKRSNKIPSGTKLSISFLLLAVALVALTLIIVATNPSPTSPKAKASSSQTLAPSTGNNSSITQGATPSLPSTTTTAP